MAADRKLSEQQWRQRLSPEQYRVLRQRGTEPPFSGKYNAHKKAGTYRCAACGEPLFASSAKFDSGSGWPSFIEPIESGKVGERTDHGHGMVRVEVLCSACESHLGHVFDDGPAPTGRRFCINSVCLDFDDSSD